MIVLCFHVFADTVHISNHMKVYPIQLFRYLGFFGFSPFQKCSQDFWRKLRKIYFIPN